MLDDSLRLLATVLPDAEEKRRRQSVLEVLILQALAFSAQGLHEQGLLTLKRALQLAEPEGPIRLFVDEGAAMRALLRSAQRAGITPAYVTRLLAAYNVGMIRRSPLATIDNALVEPLTPREQEVLEFLMEGASNRQIAQRLVLSLSTVKKYVYTICGKLAVQNRTQAAIRARALQLVDQRRAPTDACCQ